VALRLRFQPPPIEPCMLLSNTRLSNVLHVTACTSAEQRRSSSVILRLAIVKVAPDLHL